MNDYIAKATQPPGNPWQERNLTLEKATQRAKWFVREWYLNGLTTAEACVFHNNGNLVSAITRDSL